METGLMTPTISMPIESRILDSITMVGEFGQAGGGWVLGFGGLLSHFVVILSLGPFAFWHRNWGKEECQMCSTSR